MGNFLTYIACNQLWCLDESIWYNNIWCSVCALLIAFLLLYNFHVCVESARGSQGRSQLLGGGDELVDQREDDSGFDYGMRHGPHTWLNSGHNQSPINIDTSDVVSHCMMMPLKWHGYEKLPQGVLLENNGHTLVVRAAFDEELPYLAGADLLYRFRFHEISFRWNWHSNAGSEHTLDNHHFPLEMQCLHTTAEDTSNASSDSLLLVSYFFELSAELPYLDVIIQHLVAVQTAGKRAEIPAFPLSYLMQRFATEFYSYHGSLTSPPCHAGAEWFIYPLPLAISQRQLHEFHKLRSCSGARITCNARPVQDLDNRCVRLNRCT